MMSPTIIHEGGRDFKASAPAFPLSVPPPRSGRLGILL
jgi:hypothetical protein